MHNLERYSLNRNQTISTQKLISLGARFLNHYGIKNAKNEIEWFLQDLLHCDKIKLDDFNINNKQHNLVIDFLMQRSKKNPFQYLLGKGSFFGRDFIVDKNVLIPRPETEILINIIKDNKYNNLLDIGTGCGCLAITAIIEKIAVNADAIDISNPALRIAKKNAELLKINNIKFFNCDIMSDKPNKKYDIIVSNPPYISMEEYEVLDDEVKNFEPIIALTDFNDGMIFYRRLSKVLKEILNPNGVAVLEISHFFNTHTILDIFNNFSDIEFFRDLNNDHRAVKIINK